MPRTLRRAVAALVATVAGATTSVALASGPAPAGAAGPLWDLTVDQQPAVVADAPLQVKGRADVLTGAIIALDPVATVTVALVPTADDWPRACTTDALTKTVTPSAKRYSAELTPPCNGPYRIEVTAKTRGGQSSGAPVVSSVKVADPGDAPAAPRAVGTANGLIVSWSAAATPDVVGWTVTGGLAAASYDAATTGATIAASPGTRQVGLVARRWGADGPGGAEVTSPSSTSGSVTVTAPPPAEEREPTLPSTPAASPPRASGGGPGANLPSADRTTTPSRSSGVTVPARRPPTGTPEGYREDLPYGAPDEAFRPGDDPAADAGGADGDGGDERAGTSPSASLVQTRDETSPGLVAPVALAILMATIATHIAWYLRRSRPQGLPQQGSLA